MRVKCPQCRELIQADALKGRYCGHELTEDERGSNAKNGRFAAIAVGIVLLLLLGLCSLGLPPSPTDTSSTVTDRAPREVTPAELVSAYEQNEAAAQQQYGGRPLRITGTVTDISLDISDDPIIGLEGRNEYQGVRLDLADDSKSRAAELSQGQVITVTCENITEIVGTPYLRECRF